MHNYNYIAITLHPPPSIAFHRLPSPSFRFLPVPFCSISSDSMGNCVERGSSFFTTPLFMHLCISVWKGGRGREEEREEEREDRPALKSYYVIIYDVTESPEPSLLSQTQTQSLNQSRTIIEENSNTSSHNSNNSNNSNNSKRNKTKKK